MIPQEIIRQLKSMAGRLTGEVSYEPRRCTEESGIDYCTPEQAEFWSVYVEFNDHGCHVSDWIEDFDTEQDAARFAEELSKFIKSDFHSEA